MRNLDALRIIAACAVVVLHYSDYVKDIPIGQFMVEHVWHFNLFVDLFFVVSGFVIASQYLGRVRDRHAVGRFLWRRLARIYPLHLADVDVLRGDCAGAVFRRRPHRQCRALPVL